MRWLATEVAEVVAGMAVVVEADAEAVEEASPAQTLRLWVEVAVGKLSVLFWGLRPVPYIHTCGDFDNC